MLRRLLVAFAVAAFSALTLGVGGAWADASAVRASGEIVSRPTSGGSFAYAAPEESPFVGEHAVVHYVATGLDAPPLNDDDASGYPDYVEQIGAAADAAFASFESASFRAPLPDSGGPDAKPDIYVKRLDPGVFGLALPQAQAELGAFVLVSPGLDPAPDKAFASLRMTVAHEAFHLVQFAYLPDGNLPRWAAEGMANAMALAAFPDAVDLVAAAQLAGWLREPWRSLYDEANECSRCYGSAWWWLYLGDLRGSLLNEYLIALARPGRAPDGTGVESLREVLRAHGYSLAKVFAAFSLRLYRDGYPVASAYKISLDARTGTSPRFALAGLGTHYVDVRVAAGARGVAVVVFGEAKSNSRVRLLVGGPRGRVVVAKPLKRGGGAVVSTTFRNARERKQIVLMISSGSEAPDRYRLAATAVPRSGKLPGWIAAALPR